VIRHQRGLLIISQVDPHDRMIKGQRLPKADCQRAPGLTKILRAP
jgi:hypothetical protein